MQSGHRRLVIQRIFGEAEARGNPVDHDPAFLQWVEEWIEGLIDVGELRRRYIELRDVRLFNKRARQSVDLSVQEKVAEDSGNLLQATTQLTDAYEESYSALGVTHAGKTGVPKSI
jgi:uncharacterized Zn finger protein